MSKGHLVQSTGSIGGDEKGAMAALGLSKWLGLAAAPTFAVMALLTALGGSPMNGPCSSAGAPMSAMMLMYLLMSAFHTPPWLKLIFGRQGPFDRS